ncbi:MAG: 2OG-Fe(II) oxygenase [Polaromonas sp.]|nr:2OG-Fe(II) oxygenase [Polaromonas sp.]
MPEPPRLAPQGLPTAPARQQAELFGTPDLQPLLPEGLTYQPDFLSVAEEALLLEWLATLALEPARYKGYTARRRVLSYGSSYDFEANRLLPSAELAAELRPLRAGVAGWLGIPPGQLVHAMVAEYRPGTPLGWHRDVPDFEEVVGVSLGTPAVMRFRPYPHRQGRHERAGAIRLALAPRSIYRMQGAARWAWQHSVAPTPGHRWSVTFRTAARVR